MPTVKAAAAPAAEPTSAAGPVDDLAALLNGSSATETTPEIDPELDEPEEPETPADPENPEDPETPEDPENPEDPVAPEEPEDPAPEDPENPEEPETPKAVDEDAADLIAKAKFSPEQQKFVDKIVGKKAAKIEALRVEVEPLKQQVAALAQENESLKQGLPPPTPTAESPLADVTSEADLAAREKNAKEFKRWLAGHRDGGDYSDGKGGVVQISPERRDELLAEIDELLTDTVPARRQFLTAKRTFDHLLHQKYPVLADPKSPAAINVDAVYRMYSGRRLSDIPEARLFCADALLGKVTRENAERAAAQAANGKKPGAAPAAAGTKLPPKAPATPGATRVPGKVHPKAKARTVAVEKFAKTGRDDGNVVLGSILKGG